MNNLRISKVYDINDFISWEERGELEISPKYQRNSVWNGKAKSYLIDTIMRGLPIPPIFIRQSIDTKVNKSFKDVLDGQQRIRTILEFYRGMFYVQKSHNIDIGGLYYNELSDEQKEDFLSYSIPVEIITTKDDSIVYDMFARLNTNNMALNKQELRNAKYWGEFKIFNYRLASEIREFLVENKIFNDKELSRMLEIEFISTLTILILSGIKTDTPASIDKYYAKYDLEFSESQEVYEKFNTVIDLLKIMFNKSLGINSKLFKKKVYFYTLFATIYNQVYGLKDLEEFKVDKSIDKNLDKYILALMDFEALFNDVFDSKKIKNDDMIRFEKLHTTRTTNEKERKERIRLLLQYLSRKI